MMTSLLKLMLEFRDLFPQQRTFSRARRLMLSGILTIGRHWLSRMISTAGRDLQDWSADYRVFSRSPWHLEKLFTPIMRAVLGFTGRKYLAVAVDDTNLPRGGSKVVQAGWLRDPLSPPFHLNLKRALRFLHFSALPRKQDQDHPGCRGIPVGFNLVEVVKKPKKKAPEAEWQAYKEARKTMNLSSRAVMAMHALRVQFDEAGAKDSTLIIVGDGSFCNKTVMRAELERAVVLARTRKDAALCWPAEPGGRKVYGSETFTPEQVRLDPNRRWRKGTWFTGGAKHTIRFKECKGFYWRKGTGQIPMRLIVLAPTGYQNSPKGKKHYRKPAYLLTRDLKCPTKTLIQSYLDRWQIEVNHRDLKDVMGLGDAQVWAKESVPRQPAFIVASYSLLLLAGLRTHGPRRTKDYLPLPKWRRQPKRASCLDLIALVRKEAIDQPQVLEGLGIRLGANGIALKAAG